MAQYGEFTHTEVTNRLGLVLGYSAIPNEIAKITVVTVTGYLFADALSVTSPRNNQPISIGSYSTTYDVPRFSTDDSYGHMPSRKTLFTASHVFTHNTTGDGFSVNTSFSFTLNQFYAGWVGTMTASGTIAIAALDLTPSTVNISLTGRTTSSLTFDVYSNYKSSDCYVSVDDGVTWVLNSSGSSYSAVVNVTGLTPDTEYKVKVRVKRDFNYVLSYSATATVKTVGASYFTDCGQIIADISVPSLDTRVQGYNATYKTTIEIYDGTTHVVSLTSQSVTVGNVVQNIPLTSTQRKTLLTYMSAKKTAALTFKLYTFTADNVAVLPVSEITSTVLTTSETSAPLFTTVTYKDTVATAIAVTGSDQQLVRYRSSLQFSCEAATARNETTIDYYALSFDANTTTVLPTVTPVIITHGVINNVSGIKTATITAFDKRGYNTSVTIDIPVADYFNPHVSYADIRRHNGVDEVIELSFNGKYAAVKIGGVDKNTMDYIEVKFRKTSVASWGNWMNKTSECAIGSGDFSYDDGHSFDLDPEYSYYVATHIRDSFGVYTEHLMLVPQGIPLITIRPKKIGINVAEPTAALDVEGGCVFSVGGVVIGRIDASGWHGKFTDNL